MKVKELMNPTIFTIDSEKSLFEAFKVMNHKGVKRVFVRIDENIDGVITYRDLAHLFFEKGVFELMDVTLKDVSTKEILTIDENADVAHAAQMMLHADVSGLLVIDEQKNAVGVISQTDILRALVKG
ncbi:CBS domain-containing protein [Methanococcus maripaludis]|uniref:Putative transcriptional regulator n=1 Tax=Methanococcus maripaludis TaxID=39152 RepID=A0A8T4H4H7_METMI|nr:CBS domain-containing protein [Methanococcus maripaludis]MBM7408940.1 putative transcriptional regulator [Methanococcus maripaludis]MBP2218874.1 putative transcriptional regulator [Methanococcus maripaludis]